VNEQDDFLRGGGGPLGYGRDKCMLRGEVGAGTVKIVSLDPGPRCQCARC
jgi:hypothetical protein